jgi:hypothetical protein
MFVYETYHHIGWHHYGRNGIDLLWYIHDMDFRCVIYKIQVIYEIYHPIGWHHYGRNGIELLSWYIHNMDFRCVITKIHVHI